MVEKRRSLSVFRIRERIGKLRVSEFDDVIVEGKELVTREIRRRGFTAKVFVLPPIEKRPPWAEFLESGFGAIPEVSTMLTNSAVLMAKVRYNQQDRFFAFAFGLGRHLLKRNSYVRNYGLRVALNAVYQRGGLVDPSDYARLRSVDAKTVAADTIHTRRQADHWATFEAFGIDIDRDLLRRVTGEPVDTGDWGTRVTGADAIRLNYPLRFNDIGSLCKRIEKTYLRDDYLSRFRWVDNVHTVGDLSVIGALESALLDSLKSDSEIENLELAPPELVDWDSIKCFRYSVNSKKEYEDLDLEKFLELLRKKKQLTRLSVEDLKNRTIDAVDNDGKVMGHWSVYQCMTGELKFDHKTYLISDGDFFEVAAGYMNTLDKFVEGLKECSKTLPKSKKGEKEGPYNKRAANDSSRYLLLDKETVRVQQKTSPIEICDILTHDGYFIHVKRKLGSSSLSHLFSQGYVSADLFLSSEEYRQSVVGKIDAAMKKRKKAPGAARLVKGFAKFYSGAVPPSKCEVVYAIVANWKKKGKKKSAGVRMKELVEALPFFSKVNLRRHALDLKRFGYRVSYKRIDVEEKAKKAN